MKREYKTPIIEEIKFDASESIAAGCWTYAGTSDTDCDNLAIFGMPDICIPGWTEGKPAMGAS